MHRARPGVRRGGGVGILYKKSKISMKKIMLPNNKFEIISAVGKFPNNTRKMVVIVVYMPPSTKVGVMQEIQTFLVENILRLQTELNDPYFVLSLIHI